MSVFGTMKDGRHHITSDTLSIASSHIRAKSAPGMKRGLEYNKTKGKKLSSIRPLSFLCSREKLQMSDSKEHGENKERLQHMPEKHDSHMRACNNERGLKVNYTTRIHGWMMYAS